MEHLNYSSDYEAVNCVESAAYIAQCAHSFPDHKSLSYYLTYTDPENIEKWKERLLSTNFDYAVECGFKDANRYLDTKKSKKHSLIWMIIILLFTFNIIQWSNKKGNIRVVSDIAFDMSDIILDTYPETDANKRKEAEQLLEKLRNYMNY